MKKTFLLILIFISKLNCVLGQTNPNVIRETYTNIDRKNLSGALKLLIEEKTNDGKKPVINEAITAVLNDSTKHALITDQDGCIVIKNLTPGKYNVKIIRAGCQALEVKGIMIGEGKTAYVTYQLACTSYINGLTKKEKKKLGIK